MNSSSRSASPSDLYPAATISYFCKKKMARITVEDCMKKIPNRFEMVLCAAYRARQLNDGHAPRVDAKDKNTVIALREIAQGVARNAGTRFLISCFTRATDNRCVARKRNQALPIL